MAVKLGRFSKGGRGHVDSRGTGEVVARKKQVQTVAIKFGGPVPISGQWEFVEWGEINPRATTVVLATSKPAARRKFGTQTPLAATRAASKRRIGKACAW